MHYRVVERYYETGRESTSIYSKLADAKSHVDRFYRYRDDAADSCSITAVQEEEDVDYTSPWENPEYRRLMKESKEKVIQEYLRYKEKVGKLTKTHKGVV